MSEGPALGYPPEVAGNLKRMEEYSRAHTGGRIEPRARNLEQHRSLLRYKYWCEDNGIDICHLIISHAQADMAAFDQTKTVAKAGPLILNLQQQNTFISQVDRPRRLADSGSTESSIANEGIAGATRRMAFEALIILKTLPLQHSFCFRDFLELSPNHFEKVISRLKRKGFVATVEPRTCPRFYRLTPKLLMRFVSEYSRLLHLPPIIIEGSTGEAGGAGQVHTNQESVF